MLIYCSCGGRFTKKLSEFAVCTDDNLRAWHRLYYGTYYLVTERGKRFCNKCYKLEPEPPYNLQLDFGDHDFSACY